MSNKVKEIDIKTKLTTFFDDISNLKNFDPNNTKIDEKSYKNILIYYIGYVTIKYSKYVKINAINSLYLIFNRMNRYFEENNINNKYLTLVPTNENKEKIKIYEELLIKNRDLIRSITKISDDYDEKYMKIKFNLDNELPLNKTIEIPTMTIVVRAVFHKNSKCYSELFIDECLYKI